MDERGANIDIVFRNGFKDYEVLPPPEIWDRIQPVIGKKEKSLLLLRSAAMIVVLLSIGFLVYKWSREVTSDTGIQTLTRNEQSIPVIENNQIPAKPQIVNKTSDKTVYAQSSPEKSNPVSEIIQKSEAKILQVPDFSSETGKGTLKEGKIFAGMQIVSLTSPPSGILALNDINKNLTDKTLPAIESHRWSIAALASPTYYSQFNSSSGDLSNQMTAAEQPIMSYSGGVTLSYKINKRISVQSGIYYASLGQEVTGISSFGGFQPYGNAKSDHNFEVLTTSGRIFTNNSDIFLADGTGSRVITQFTKDVFDPGKASLQFINNSLKQNFSYLELPIVLRYKLIDGSLGLNLIGGMSYNFLLNNSVYAISNGTRYPIGKTQGLSMVTLSSSLGMGMEYSFTNKISMNLEPTFRYYLNPFNDLAGSKIHPYTFGIFSGLSYKF
jgi:hypothetical protein